MNKERILSLLRRGLIVLLTASAVFLALESGVFTTGRQTAMGTEVTGAPAPESGEASENAVILRPEAVLVFRADGSRRVSMYDGAATEHAFGQFAALLGEALGTAELPESLTEAEFRSGLVGDGVLLALGADYPLEQVARWLGAGAPARTLGETSLLYLTPGAASVELYFRRSEGDFARCATSAHSELLRARLEEFAGTECLLAFEDETLAGIAPYTILPEVLPELPQAGATVPALEPRSLMTAFGMNSYVASGYRESDGTEVYLDDQKTLRIAPDGTVTFLARGALSPAEGEGSAIDQALRLGERTLGRDLGDAVLAFSQRTVTGTVERVTLVYTLRGVPVHLAAGAAAELSFQNGRLLQAVLRPRSFALREELTPVAPARFAAAIAAGEGGAPSLVYLERGDWLHCVWVNH